MSLGFDRVPVTVPSGCARFTYELAYMPEKILRTHYKKLVQVTDHVGGHFAAFEVPNVLANDVIQFVKTVEKLPKADKKAEL